MPKTHLFTVLVLSLIGELYAFTLQHRVASRSVQEAYHYRNKRTSFENSWCFKAASNLPENDPVDMELSFDDLDTEISTDRKLEISMAKELYDELRGEDALLTREKFTKWEDIAELLSKGAFDSETLDIIYKECHVLGDVISFDQFLEIVELVNQVSAVLDQDLQAVISDNLETEIMENDEDERDLGLPDLSWMPKSIQ